MKFRNSAPCHKSARSYRDGYKAQVCAEPDTGLVTAVDLTAGDTADAEAAAGLLAGEPAGTTVLADSAYGTGALRAHLRDRDMTAVIKPPPLRTAVEGGYSIDDFDIDTAAGTVTCPAGVTVSFTPKGHARFGNRCRNCPVVAELHEFIVASIPAGITARATQRPADGFAASPAFEPGHPARRALRDAYPRLRHLVYSDENWIEFDDTLAVIHDSSALI